MPTARPKPKRTVKTPEQRAREALDAANRAVVKLDRKVDTTKALLAGLERELAAAIRRRDYLAQNPDLPTTAADTPANTTDGSTTA